MTLTGAQRVRLGLFVLIGLVVLGAALVAVVGKRMWTESIGFSVRYRESVSGLDVGSPVRYQGLRVGRVGAMRIAPDDPGAIEVDLALDPGTVLYEGTVARLDQAGLTGLTYINLMTGDMRANVAAPGTRLVAGGSLTSRITGEAEVLRAKVETGLDLGLALMSEQNRKRVEAVLDDTDMLIRNLDLTVGELRPQIQAAISRVDDAAGSFEQLGKQGQRTLRGADETLVAAQRTLGEAERVLAAIDGDTLRATLASTKSATARIDARVSEAELGKAIAGIQEALVATKRTIVATATVVDSVGLTVRALREDVGASLRQVRESSEHLRSFSRDIARDPSVLLRGREEAKP